MQGRHELVALVEGRNAGRQHEVQVQEHVEHVVVPGSREPVVLDEGREQGVMLHVLGCWSQPRRRAQEVDVVVLGRRELVVLVEGREQGVVLHVLGC